MLVVVRNLGACIEVVGKDGVVPWFMAVDVDGDVVEVSDSVQEAVMHLLGDGMTVAHGAVAVDFDGDIGREAMPLPSNPSRAKPIDAGCGGHELQPNSGAASPRCRHVRIPQGVLLRYPPG